ncbi:MAG: hypothetical protein WAZ18_00620 [Alphaproteobacteria bacterium]
MTMSTSNLYTTPRPRRVDSADSPTVWQFTTPEEALYWSADVLRTRHTPKLMVLWKYVLAEALEPTANEPAVAHRLHLPDDPEDRFSLAMAVERLIGSMGDEGKLLRLHAWGDWVSPGHLRNAQRLQAEANLRGERLLLNHRLSFRQLGVLFRCDHKTAAKRVRDALRTLALRLQSEGLLFVPAE